MVVNQLIDLMKAGDIRALARAITVVENELQHYDQLLQQIKINKQIPVIGITGPPGAGKSTLINALISKLTSQNKKIGIIAVDPTSPFNHGSLLGDRLRMADHFNNANVFIRSLATRGSLGGLSAKIIEVVDVMRAFSFDYIFVETVGVGQSEIEIVGLADVTVLVLVPEAGDDVQTIKSGIMEIADVFVLNKADRDGADTFIKNLQALAHGMEEDKKQVIEVVKCIATQDKGIDDLIKAFTNCFNAKENPKKIFLLTEKAYRLIQSKRMADIDKDVLTTAIKKASTQADFNLYQFVSNY